MTTPFRIKRSAVPGKAPQVDDLQFGELALNTYDAELYTKRARAGIGTDVVRVGSGASVTNIYYVTKDGKTPTRVRNLATPKQQSEQPSQSLRQSQDQLLKFLLELT